MIKYSKIGNEVLPWYRIPTDYLNRLTADDFCDKYFAGASAFLLLKTGRREENNMLLSLALIFYAALRWEEFSGSCICRSCWECCLREFYWGLTS